MDLSIDVVNERDKLIAVLVGEVDVYTAPKLKESLLFLVKKEQTMLEVDMTGVSYMDSTGLGVIISVLKAAKEHESQLRLSNLQDSVMRLFHITGLDKVIDISVSIREGR
ncbi:STAS domain-containing protein [Lentibacillus saliphilus]|uniref:STAS domain-containing protein n=1 Tax=Lentibacillus saliphilus TaxID=2737028 RepID=UPI001C2F42DD